MTQEVKSLYNDLKKNKISVDHLDLISIKPIDSKNIIKSVKKTGRLLVLDTGFKTNSISSEIITIINENCFKNLKSQPMRITVPDIPEPTSYGLTKYYYPNKLDILNKIFKILNIKKINLSKIKILPGHHDTPGKWFKGPF